MQPQLTAIQNDLNHGSQTVLNELQGVLFNALGPSGLNILGDVNHDGKIDINDVSIVLTNPAPTACRNRSSSISI